MLALARHLAHEIIVLGQVEQQAAGALLAREGCGDLRAHPRQARDPEQELLRARLDAVEDLPCQVVEDDLGSRVDRQVSDSP